MVVGFKRRGDVGRSADGFRRGIAIGLGVALGSLAQGFFRVIISIAVAADPCFGDPKHLFHRFVQVGGCWAFEGVERSALVIFCLWREQARRIEASGASLGWRRIFLGAVIAAG